MSQPMKLAIFDSSITHTQNTQPVMFMLFDYEQVSAKALIRRRVTYEVEQFQQRREIINTLVPIEPHKKPYTSEVLDNINAEQYCQQAIDAFQQGRFFIIVDQEQITELEEMIRLREQSKIEFFRLTPLVGG